MLYHIRYPKDEHDIWIFAQFSSSRILIIILQELTRCQYELAISQSRESGTQERNLQDIICGFKQVSIFTFSADYSIGGVSPQKNMLPPSTFSK
ncbi:hypothetical protein FGO68_gene16020 [Halteria grandinella]|uniref:Uncharacterized protein n=1 Tax=Halteria grandinella TaxID=5974 RepID=A0A8J8NEI9_HALGN|nr:hypothetical protein FGO68_gene16020 [Halteria grandinella]